MSAVVRAELLKLRTTRTALGFAAGIALLVVAGTLLSALAGEDPVSLEDKRGVIGFGGFVGALVLVFGVVGSSGDFRHRTLAPSLLIAPDRARLTVARVLAYAVVAAIIAVLAAVLCFTLAAIALAGVEGPSLGLSDYAEIGGGSVLAMALSAMIGVGIGVLVGNQVTAVIGALIWLLVLEPLIIALSEGLSDFSITAAQAAVAGGTGDGLPSFAGGVAVLLGWAVLFAAAGVLVDRRREVR